MVPITVGKICVDFMTYQNITSNRAIFTIDLSPSLLAVVITYVAFIAIDSTQTMVAEPTRREPTTTTTKSSTSTKKMKTTTRAPTSTKKMTATVASTSTMKMTTSIASNPGKCNIRLVLSLPRARQYNTR